MGGPTGPWSAEIPRRRVLGLAAGAAGLGLAALTRAGLGAGRARRREADDPALLPASERLHVPVLRLPLVASHGAKVPVVVEMAHPMEPGHHVRTLQLVNERDPVPSKGVFHFTPVNGQVYLAYQIRVDAGVSELSAIADCSRHGRRSGSRSVNVPPGAGGCAAPAPPARPRGPELLPPQIRIPALLRRERIEPGEVIDVQVTMRHPNRTGLAYRGGAFVQDSEPFHLTDMEVFLGSERVSRFAMTSALSDDPLITFRLRPRRDGLVRVVLRNTRGERFEASHPLPVA